MNTEAFERRRFSRRLDDCRPEGGAFLVTLCIFSLVAGAMGFALGTWFGWCLQ